MAPPARSTLRHEETCMRNVRQILVAVKDPFARSLPGIKKAARVARACGANLEIFHALALPLYVAPGEMPAETPARCVDLECQRRVRRLDAIAGRLRRTGIEVTTAATADYPAYEAVIRRAERIGADLIVADCHAGGQHRAPWLLHLTDWELLRHSPAPVLLVKNTRTYRHPVLLAAVDPAHAFAKPSKLDAQILRTASTLKSALRGSLHVMHAFYPVPPAGVAPAELLDPNIADELQKRAESIAKKGFLRVVQEFEIAPSRRYLVPGHPFDTIQSVARQTRADIVVMGAISRSGLKRLFIGNTAEQVLDALACDVLIVKDRNFRSGVRPRPRGARFVNPSPPPMLPF
jgi:universal stress protein E